MPVSPRQTLAGSLTGVFVGLTHGDYALLAADAHALEGPYGFIGTNFSMASGRIAYALGLHGPAITVDTACSSGLLAVHMACRSLHDGESDLALAGGAAVMLEPRKFVVGVGAGHAVSDRTLPCVRRRGGRVRVAPRVASWCCSSGCRMRCAMVTGSWR